MNKVIFAKIFTRRDQKVMECKISAVIITLNEEKNIQECIDSVKDVADEIVVVDSFSTDKTEEICRNNGVKFLQRRWEGYGKQKNWANQQTTYDYILSLDADERLSDGLKKAISTIKKDWRYDVYSFKRLWHFQGRKLRFSLYPDPQLRLFDRRKTQWNENMVHERLVTGKGITVKRIHEDINHFVGNIQDLVNTLNNYSTLSAQYSFEMGKKPSIFKLIFSPTFSFIKNYFFKLGFLDGFFGLFICLIFSHYRFLKYAKRIELYKNQTDSQKTCRPQKIGVIISTYNHPDWLQKTLWGYCCQWRPADEIVIADDGSREDTRLLIESFKDKLPITHIWQEDKGFRKSKILNKALLASMADYLIFTDQDCVPRADFIETHQKYAQKGYFLSGGYFRLNMDISQKLNQDCIASGMAFHLKWLREQKQRTTFKLTKLVNNKHFTRFMDKITTTKPTWNGCNASGWRTDLLYVNGFNEEMQYGGQDREFGERLINWGIKGRQIRFSAILLHLDHARPYKNDETLTKNLKIRKNTKANQIVKTPNGIEKF